MPVRRGTAQLRQHGTRSRRSDAAPARRKTLRGTSRRVQHALAASWCRRSPSRRKRGAARAVVAPRAGAPLFDRPRSVRRVVLGSIDLVTVHTREHRELAGARRLRRVTRVARPAVPLVRSRIQRDKLVETAREGGQVTLGERRRDTDAHPVLQRTRGLPRAPAGHRRTRSAACAGPRSREKAGEHADRPQPKANPTTMSHGVHHMRPWKRSPPRPVESKNPAYFPLVIAIHRIPPTATRKGNRKRLAQQTERGHKPPPSAAGTRLGSPKRLRLAARFAGRKATPQKSR